MLIFKKLHKIINEMMSNKYNSNYEKNIREELRKKNIQDSQLEKNIDNENFKKILEDMKEKNLKLKTR